MTWRELTDDDVEHASVDCRCNYADHHSTLEEEASALYAFHHQHGLHARSPAERFRARTQGM